MSATVLLLTDRPGFEPVWRPACEQLGLTVETVPPDRLPGAVRKGVAVVVDAASALFDEDEILASVGLARAVGAVAAVQLPADGSMSGVEDLLDELCPGLVARAGTEAYRIAALLARQLDTERGGRFEFMALSPRDNELLAIMGGGRCMLVHRPASQHDDGTEVVSIALGKDAKRAEVELSSGARFTIDAHEMAGRGATNGNGTSGEPVEGARLGARLRQLRLAAGLTQAELARRTGIHRPNIARVEAGRHTPSLDTLARLAKAIGVPTTRVLCED